MKTTLSIWQHSTAVQGAIGSRHAGQALRKTGATIALFGIKLERKGASMVSAADEKISASTLRVAELRRRRLMTPMEREAAEIDDLSLEVSKQQDVIAAAEATVGGASLRSIERLAKMRVELHARQERYEQLEAAQASMHREPDRSQHTGAASEPEFVDLAGTQTA